MDLQRLTKKSLMVIVAILFCSVLAIIALIGWDFYSNKYASLEEYSYCKIYFDKNLEYQQDKSKYYMTRAADGEGKPVIQYFSVSPFVVKKYENDAEAGFWGLANIDGKCVLRKYVLTYKGFEINNDKGMFTDVTVSGKNVDYKSALDLITINKSQQIFVLDQGDWDALQALMCDIGDTTNVYNRYKTEKNYCFFSNRFVMQSDGYFDLVISITNKK